MNSILSLPNIHSNSTCKKYSKVDDITPSFRTRIKNIFSSNKTHIPKGALLKDPGAPKKIIGTVFSAEKWGNIWERDIFIVKTHDNKTYCIYKEKQEIIVMDIIMLKNKLRYMMPEDIRNLEECKSFPEDNIFQIGRGGYIKFSLSGMRELGFQNHGKTLKIKKITKGPNNTFDIKLENGVIKNISASDWGNHIKVAKYTFT